MKQLVSLLVTISILLLVTISILLLFTEKAEKPMVLKAIDDGPYIYIENHHLKVDWICQSKTHSIRVKTEELPYIFDQCGLYAELPNIGVTQQNLFIKGDFKVAALSDMHGQYDIMIELLKNNQIIDEDMKWKFGKNHLVVNGDMLDRGPKHTEILWFLYALEKQAAIAGGSVHTLLGNHEVLILNDREKYRHEKYKHVAELFDKPYSDLFTEDAVLGKWLRSKMLLVKINDTLFVHAGLHPKLIDENISLSTINQVFNDNLIEDELEAPRAGLAKLLHSSEGPVWYRGYFKNEMAKDNEIKRLLSHFDVQRIVVGHTSRKHVESHFNGKVVAIDSSMKYGKYGEMLFIENGDMWRANLKGDKMPL